MVARVLAAHDLEHALDQVHAPREHADHLERRGVRHEAVAGHGAVGGLQAEEPAERGGLPHRAARVAAEREVHDARGHRRRRAAAGAAGHPAVVEGVQRPLERRVLRRRAHAELVEVGLARHDRARTLQAFHRRCRIGGDDALEQPGAAGELVAADGDVVLDAERRARERAGRRGVGRADRGVELQEGPDRRVALRGPFLPGSVETARHALGPLQDVGDEDEPVLTLGRVGEESDPSD